MRQDTWLKATFTRLEFIIIHYNSDLGFSCGSACKESKGETWVRSLGWEDPLEKVKATYLLQYSGLENPMDCIVHGVAESKATEWLLLSNSDLALQLRQASRSSCFDSLGNKMALATQPQSFQRLGKRRLMVGQKN